MSFSVHSSCSAEQFTCGNGFCVPKLWRCDGENDCGDNSDEAGCVRKSCAANMFACSDGKCIPSYWRCDFDHDCLDGSDEQGCCKLVFIPYNILLIQICFDIYKPKRILVGGNILYFMLVYILFYLNFIKFN